MEHSNPFESPATSEPPVYNTPGRASMTLKYIHPLQAGKVLGALYLLLSLIIAPFFVLVGLASGDAAAAGATIGMALVMLVVYGVAGLIFGVIGTLVYNVVASMAGGLRFDFE